MLSLREWLDHQWERESMLLIKRLSASDTLAMGEENSGPKIPTDLILEIFPEVEDLRQARRSFAFLVRVDSSKVDSELMANLSVEIGNVKGALSQPLFTDWGGSSNSMLNPENTGAVAVLAFQPSRTDSLPTCDVWICANLDEEDIVESDWGSIDPGFEICWSHTKGPTRRYLL